MIELVSHLPKIKPYLRPWLPFTRRRFLFATVGLAYCATCGLIDRSSAKEAKITNLNLTADSLMRIGEL